MKKGLRKFLSILTGVVLFYILSWVADFIFPLFPNNGAFLKIVNLLLPVVFIIGGGIIGGIWLYRILPIKFKKNPNLVKKEITQEKKENDIIKNKNIISNLQSIGIIFLSIVLVVFIILIISSVKNKQTKTTSLDLKIKCEEKGSNLYNQDIEDSNSEYTVFNPEYYYNKKLDTCLYSGGILGNDGYLEKWVKDSLTNKTLVNFIITGTDQVFYGSACPECVYSVEEFDEQKEKLLNE
jgi:amino acid transporter